MPQSKLGSLLEACANTALGYLIALASQLAIFPHFGIHLPLQDNLAIGAWFTLISLLRGYVLRRWFNARLHTATTRVARVLTGEKSE